MSGAMLILTPAHLAAAQADEPAASEATSQDDPEAIVVTGIRTRLPVSALPVTVDVVGGKDLTDQVAVSGSVIDAISAKLPSFSPTREKLSGAGESLRGRSPLFAINGVPQSTPIRDGSRDGYTIDPFFIDRVEVIYGSNALQGIGATGSTNLGVVAPGIAEALIATAAGLFAAIPAVYFYNHLASRVKLMASEMDDFSLEFLSISERNFT